MEGWITLNREIRDHWVYSDAENFRAWVTILMEVNHSEQKIMIGKTLFTCARGESLRSLESWGKLFGNWSKSKTKRFFDTLKRETMIELKNERLTTRLSVCNYNKYQDVRNADETQMKRKRNADETQVKRERATNNNELTMGTMINNENKEIPLPEKSGECVLSEKEIRFEKFWGFYERKGNKQSAKKAFMKLSESKLAEMASKVKSYVESTPDKQYRLDAENYLNATKEHWNDEIRKPISKTIGIISETEQQRRAGQFNGGKVSKLRIIDESHLFV